jgi:hypothetical protein
MLRMSCGLNLQWRGVSGTEQPFDLKGDVQSEQMTAMREIMTFTRSR